MKKVYFFLIINFFAFTLSAQHLEEHQIKVSYEKKVCVDSFRIFRPFEKVDPQNLTEFSNTLVSTPVKACQAFISFTTKIVGKELASDGYGSGGFPSDKTIEYRKMPEFQTNRYLKVYLVLYFKYKNIPHSATLVETYLDKSHPKYFTVFEHKCIDEKWLLANDWYLSRFESLSKLKPQFAQSLISGKPINGNNKFNKLLNAVYLNNSIDVGVLDECISKEEFDELLNN